MFLRLISFVFCFIFWTSSYAQQPNQYSQNWKKVEEFEKKGLTQSALKEVITIFNLALAANNDAQLIKSAMYQMKYRNMVEQDNQENNIFYIDTLVAKTKTPARNILLSMQAELFQNYRQNNRYRLYDRTELAEEKSNDINTWGINTLNERIASLYKASLQNEQILKRTNLNGLDAILVKGKNTRPLRPTLYDFLAHRALNYYINDENSATQPAYKFIINEEKAFAPIPSFIEARFVTKDTASLYYKALLLFQDVLRFHLNDPNPDALIDADLQRLAFVNNHGVFTNKDQLYEAALKNIEERYSNSSVSAQAMYLRAQLYAQRGEQYHPITNKEKQFEIKKAIALAEAAAAKYPKSEGGINAKNLVTQLKMPVLNLKTEKVNLPLQPFRSLVSYKNVDKAYFRIIKTTREEISRMEKSEYENRWKDLIRMNPIKSWTVSLPNPGDHQDHSTEIKIDALPAGTYIILSGIKSDFSLSDNIIARQIVYVSSISYLISNQKDMYVLDRDNGTPLANAEVQFWSNQYNYTTRKYEEVKKEKYTTDVNGYVKLKATTPKNHENYNSFIQVKYNKEELYTDDTYYSYDYYTTYERPSTKRTFLFSDRSLYRPGQVVYFKGIAVNTDSASKKTSILSGFNTTVILFDANRQKAGSIHLKTNEYGSYNGSLTLPEGILNGQFYLFDSVSQSSLYFNVEEYKRPKFMVEVKKPEGTYRVNDSIRVTGNARAYAGNAIDGATVSYRVVRKVMYPMWWYSYRIWPPYNRGGDMEITNGIATTDSKGDFIITFKAIPDETVDRKGQPVFHYEVSADITDINGETRSGSTSVAVSYQALQLTINAPEKLPADSLHNIKISSTNMNVIHEKASVNLTMHKLQSPGRIFRKRYWETPDQFIMSKNEYYAAFPYDAWADEDQVSKWALGAKVIDMTDTTSSNGKWLIPRDKILTPGWYKITVTTKDKYGEDVKSEKFIEITGVNVTDQPIQFTVKNRLAEPGQQINYNIATGFDKIFLIHSILKTDKSIQKSYPVVTASNPFSNQINVSENDRGGININYAFVKHNRVYTGNEPISVPWTNKELIIAYETFRDKILPGSEEKWKMKISGSKGEKVAAEILVSMYDASLDQFKKHDWAKLSSIWPQLSQAIVWTTHTFLSVDGEQHHSIRDKFTTYEKSYDALINNGWTDDFNYYRNRGLTGLEYAVTMRGENVVSDASAAPTAPQLEEVRQTSANNALAGKAAGITFKNGDVASVSDTIEFNMKTQKGLAGGGDVVQIRKNFNETAFFFPALTTDANGNVEFSFTIPEALTEWKLMTMAHTKELQSGYLENKVITQKPLMVQPFAPRFVREGDQLEFSAKIANMETMTLHGTATLELFDAATNKPVDALFQNTGAVKSFTIEPGQSSAVMFSINIPKNFNSALTYRIKAITRPSSDGTTFSDGEEAMLPVLINRTLVTETMPLNLRNTTSKSFSFDKLLNNNSSTLTHHALTVEYTSNPAWYAVQALPFLMEFPYECAEQEFNRYYANTLASFIANSTPRIKAIFEKWRTADTAALMSNLQKNEELKSVLLQETPWVLQAQTEAQQKKNIALLFDMVRMASEKQKSFNKFKELQSPNGGFTWFKGGRDDRYMTQYIVTGIGHLIKLNALTGDDHIQLKTITDKALPYLDARLKEDYDNLIRNKVNLKNNNLSYIAIQYLYMRSFFPGKAVSNNAKTAYSYYRGQAQKHWLTNSKYMQAMIALAMHRTGDSKTATDIIRSLKENAIFHEELGMYWKDFTTGGYYWHQAPIESQAMMIEAFTDIDKNTATIDDMKTWLLKQKQVQNWRTTKATAEACYALLISPPTPQGGIPATSFLDQEREVTVALGNMIIKSSDNKSEAGTGYFKKRIEGNNIKSEFGNIKVSINSSESNPPLGGGGASWGAVYWQYFEELDKITPSSERSKTPLNLVKKLYVEKNTDKGPVLQAINDGDKLQIGDKVKVRIELRADRDMEYVHMKDMRASSMEPVNVISSYKYQGGLGYYESTKDASSNFFFGWLPRGTYVFEYPVFITHAGNFSNGITTIQCMYAPEFTSNSNGIRITVADKK